MINLSTYENADRAAVAILEYLPAYTTHSVYYIDDGSPGGNHFLEFVLLSDARIKVRQIRGRTTFAMRFGVAEVVHRCLAGVLKLARHRTEQEREILKTSIQAARGRIMELTGLIKELTEKEKKWK